MPLLFSYGTLQRPEVQMSNFGRLLDGEPDELIGFQQSLLTIDDPDFVKASGKSRHSIVRFTGGDNSRVSGTVFEVSESELARADAYEPAGYTRIAATLASGKQAWVFASDPAATDVASSAPDRAEAADYYFRYIDLVPAGNICDFLEYQRDATLALFDGISEERSEHRYADGKWSIRQVTAHVNDCERLFLSRAFWFARGFDSPLPSFDQDVAMLASGADARAWDSHVREFRAVRDASISFFRGLPGDAWVRRGIASGNPFSVRALAYLSAGHVVHHLGLIRSRYLNER